MSACIKARKRKNIFRLITAERHESDSDVPDMEPTETTKKILKQKISINAQAQLQHEFKVAGNMRNISIALCPQLKKHPTPKDINGLSPFFSPDQANDERSG